MRRFCLWYGVVAFRGFLLAQSCLSQAFVTQRIPRSASLEYLGAGGIAEVTVRTQQIDGCRHVHVDGHSPADFPPLKPQEARTA